VAGGQGPAGRLTADGNGLRCPARSLVGHVAFLSACHGCVRAGGPGGRSPAHARGAPPRGVRVTPMPMDDAIDGLMKIVKLLANLVKGAARPDVP
jgi:hypothetical protein